MVIVELEGISGVVLPGVWEPEGWGDYLVLTLKVLKYSQ
jgi:hypothetical protein